jgi:pilus assembly protein FimV
LVARILDDIDLHSLESSYIVEASDSSSDNTWAEATGNLPSPEQTAELPLGTTKIRVDDAFEKTMPIEAVPAPGTRDPSIPEGAGADRAKAADEPIDAINLDYNLTDLDATVLHVQMPSMLHEPVGFVERRTSLVDVLKKAIEREPHRGDLRMKLLETYFAAAASNRQGFLELVQNLSRERDSMPAGDWEKIASMGRQIASDSDLFASEAAPTDEEALANCA